MNILKQLYWKRLIWVVFLLLYLSLFFFNFLSPTKNWHIAYVYTLILVIWLCIEYYERHLFFQTGLLSYYHWILRTLFALFFYSSFIIGLSTMVWWQGNRTGLYPFPQIIGIGLLVYSIFRRRSLLRRTVITEAYISEFYLSLYFLTISLAFGYGSIFLFPYVFIIGYPLIFLQTRFEKTHFRQFKAYVNKTEKLEKIKMRRYQELWNKYIEHIEKKASKKR